jgi:hypothetical protein
VLPFFRAVTIPVAARGHMGASMAYWDLHGDAWFPGVYAQTVQELAQLGEPADVDCALRRYVARNAYRIAWPSDLLAALRASFPRAAVDGFARALGR